MNLDSQFDKKIGGLMLKYQRIIIFISLLGVLLCGCAGKRNPVALSVLGGAPVNYESDHGDRIIARYFTLSDHSLDFVKVTLPGSKEYTLPQVLSASGVRYTDDRELVWWTKGNTAFAEVRDKNGQWIRKYDCKEIPVDK
jgi:membrane-bound inhibitor of C-type lysozyme